MASKREPSSWEVILEVGENVHASCAVNPEFSEQREESSSDSSVTDKTRWLTYVKENMDSEKMIQI